MKPTDEEACIVRAFDYTLSMYSVCVDIGEPTRTGWERTGRECRRQIMYSEYQRRILRLTILT